jgi:hypothetical protein
MNVWVAGAIVAALVTIVASCLATVATMRFCSHCVARDKKKRMRFAYAAAAVGSLVGVFVLVAVGFLGVGAMLSAGG